MSGEWPGTVLTAVLQRWRPLLREGLQQEKYGEWRLFIASTRLSTVQFGRTRCLDKLLTEARTYSTYLKQVLLATLDLF